MPDPTSHPVRATSWQLKTRTLSFGRLPLLMGIVNVTPDSFSDGGDFFDPSKAVDHALQLVDEGADILDIGGESTRPYAEPVSPDEERRRIEPVIQSLCKQCSVPLSIDTSKAAIARVALDAGAEIINDVTGLEGDSEMIDIAVRSGAGLCAMHMQGNPQTMQDNPCYENVVAEIGEYLKQRRDTLLEAGIDSSRLCLDPGIGFGKTHQHNLTLLANCGEFHSLGMPLLVGPSRKGFIGKVLGDKSCDRTAATVGIVLSLAVQEVQIIRLHDIVSARDALLLFEATGGLEK